MFVDDLRKHNKEELEKLNKVEDRDEFDRELENQENRSIQKVAEANELFSREMNKSTENSKTAIKNASDQLSDKIELDEIHKKQIKEGTAMELSPVQLHVVDR